MEQQERKTVIAVIGMHRSGTSALTRGLQVMGIALGENLLAPVEGDNPKGFWEDVDLYELNREMLSALGMRWDHLTGITSEQVTRLVAWGFVEKANALLKKKTEKSPAFGFKDPRVAKLFPFWHRVLKRSGFDVHYVFVLRNPLSVAQSLGKRGRMDPVRAYYLWLGHVIPPLRVLLNEPVWMVDYDRLIAEPSAELRGIATALGYQIDTGELEVYQNEFLDPTLRHTRFETDDLGRDPDCPALAWEVYGEMLRVTSGESTLQEVVTEEALDRWEEELTRLEPAFRLVDRLEQFSTERDHLIQERDHFILYLDERLQRLQRLDIDRHRLEAEVHWHQAESVRIATELRRMAREFTQSTSWRLTAPFRTFMKRARSLRQILGSRPDSSRTDVTAKTTSSIGEASRDVVESATPVSKPNGLSDPVCRNDYEEWIRRYDTLDEPTRQMIRDEVSTWTNCPLISVVMPVYEAPLAYLDEAIRSVRKQLYPAWELCIADDASPSKEVRAMLERHAEEDQRIKVVFREENGHIAAASNSALSSATGDFIALLDQDDLLPEHALFCVAVEILANSELGLIYSDEDKVDSLGNRFGPYFKCEYNPELMLAHNMIAHLGVYRRDHVDAVNGFRLGVDGAQDYDLALRVIERLTPQQIKHVPRVLYHWRAHKGSTALSGDQKLYAPEAGRRVVADHLARCGVRADVIEAPDIPGMNRVRFALPEELPLVSIVIPTRDKVDLLKDCLDSIFSRTTYAAYEVILVDNGSKTPETLSYLDSLPKQRVRIVRQDTPFNFSSLVNAGVQRAQGDIVCLMNNDITVVTHDWLEELVSFAVQPGIGCVGGRLWYPDYTLQHGGVILGTGGVAGHAHKYLDRASAGYFGRAKLHQSLSAVTGALLMVRRSVFEAVDGFDETLRVAFNDVDFCIRVREAGYRNIWTPFAEFIHHESKSRGADDVPEKRVRFMLEVFSMRSRWARELDDDPAYSPNLTQVYEDFSLAWPPRVEPL